MLTDKIVVVIGSMGLLGTEFVEALKNVNGTVIAADINYINDTENKTFYIDVTTADSIKSFVKIVLNKFGKIDILVNCFAINPQVDENNHTAFENYLLEDWYKTIQTNLTGTFLCCQHFGNVMEKGSIIVNVTSQLGLVAPQQDIYNGLYIKPADYCVSAAGIIQLTKYLASYWQDKIRVNTLVPSMVFNNHNGDFFSAVSKRIPLGRMSDKVEFNEALLLLCNPKNNYMTGHTLVCDGGYTII